MRTLEELKQARKQLHMTYDELSERSGLSKSTITNIFCGYVQAPRLDTLQAIERALGLDITDEERAAGAVKYATVRVTALEDEMLQLFRELGQKRGEEAQTVVINVLENMLK